MTVAVPLLPAPRARNSELASAPDLPPTGRTFETVKERVCFYYSYFLSQLNFRDFISFVFKRVQLVHRRVPEFCAIAISIFRKPGFGIDFRGVREVEAAASSRENSSVRCGHLAKTASSAGFARTRNSRSVRNLLYPSRLARDVVKRFSFGASQNRVVTSLDDRLRLR